MKMKTTNSTIQEASAVLNKQLYLACKQVFKNVKIQNQGQSQQRSLSYDLITNKHKPSIQYSGEYYTVCCPFCNDTRFRLYINHRFGVCDEFGREELYLAHCFNEECLSKFERRLQLFDMLKGRMRFDPVIKPGKEISLSDFVATWPGRVVRLDKLDDTHVARSYLRSRSFDPDRIARFYNVHFCEESDRWLCNSRLIIPIYHNKKMRGWQARYVGEKDWKNPDTPPKYYTCPGTPRSQLLYNLGNASKYQTGIIVEGVTDVWSVGPMAVCTMGASMTPRQQSLFVSAFSGRSGVLLYDPEEMEKPATQNLISILRPKFEHGFAAVTLPEGVDPGQMDRHLMREFVTQEAAKQGCNVIWKKGGG
jgi:hypothetical protein